jgi:hypothetical protein
MYMALQGIYFLCAAASAVAMQQLQAAGPDCKLQGSLHSGFLRVQLLYRHVYSYANVTAFLDLHAKMPAELWLGARNIVI